MNWTSWMALIKTRYRPPTRSFYSRSRASSPGKWARRPRAPRKRSAPAGAPSARSLPFLERRLTRLVLLPPRSSGASVSVESRPLKRPAERVARPRKKLYGSVLDEADYYFENGLPSCFTSSLIEINDMAGLRKVVPYAFEYRSYAKGRWVGEVLLDVFRKEFRDLTPGYYVRHHALEAVSHLCHQQSAIADGRITVNGQRVGIDYVVRERDLIAHSLTRIEPPVLDEPIREIFRSPELLVVNKPPSIPVCPFPPMLLLCRCSPIRPRADPPEWEISPQFAPLHIAA